MADPETIAAPTDLKEDLDEISKYDPELRFRQATGITLKLTFYMTLILSLFHIYTAGFGVLQEWRHRAFHLAFVLPLVGVFLLAAFGVTSRRLGGLFRERVALVKLGLTALFLTLAVVIAAQLHGIWVGAGGPS